MKMEYNTTIKSLKTEYLALVELTLNEKNKLSKELRDYFGQELEDLKQRINDFQGGNIIVLTERGKNIFHGGNVLVMATHLFNDYDDKKEYPNGFFNHVGRSMVNIYNKVEIWE